MTNKRILTKAAMAATVITLFSTADSATVFDGRWRFSVGPVWDFGVKARGQLAPRQGYTSPFGPGEGLTRQQAIDKSLPDGTVVSGKRTDFASGAWIDADDPVCPEGDLPDMTRFYSFPAATYQGNGVFGLGTVGYSEADVFRPREGAYDRSISDDSSMVGINLELARNLYHSDEHGWGVDAAFGFQYFKRNGLLDLASRWFNGSSDGRWGTRVKGLNLNGLNGRYSDFNWSEDGSFYGSGGTKVAPGRYVDASGEDVYAGPISATLADIGGEDFYGSDASYGALYGDGDYENLEFLLLMRPYYDIYGWLRVFGTVGAVVSRQDLDFSLSVMRDGNVVSRTGQDFSQWDVYGVAGAGLMLSYKDFTLSTEFLARFLDDDLTFKGDYVRGTVERGSWMFKLALGYEF